LLGDENVPNAGVALEAPGADAPNNDVLTDVAKAAVENDCPDPPEGAV
jgi:hypothetical protein